MTAFAGLILVFYYSYPAAGVNWQRGLSNKAPEEAKPVSWSYPWFRSPERQSRNEFFPESRRSPDPRFVQCKGFSA